MNDNHIFLSAENILLSESKSYLQVTGRICYYDAPNRNNIQLNSKGADVIAQTLVNMPVVGRYRKSPKGQDTFGGHEMYKMADGSVWFDTDGLGTHEKVWIENNDVIVNGEEKNLPCLFASFRIWKRNNNVINAIKRLFEEKKLFTSWEIAITKSKKNQNGVTIAESYEFIGNCLLGYEYASPAYGEISVVLEVAQDEESSGDVIAAAFWADKMIGVETMDKDISTKNTQEVQEEVQSSTSSTDIKTTQETTKETTQEVIDQAYEDETFKAQIEDSPDIEKETEEKRTDKKEVTELTTQDITNRIKRALPENSYIHFLFPESKTIWVKRYGVNGNSLDIIVYTYTIVDDKVLLSAPENKTLTVSALEVYEVLDTKNTALISANEEILKLKTQVAELSAYKAQFEEVEQQRIVAENEMKREEMKSLALRSSYISESDLEENDHLKTIFNELNMSALKEYIGSRIFENLQKEGSQLHSDTVCSQDISSVVTVDMYEGNDTSVENAVQSLKSILQK